LIRWPAFKSAVADKATTAGIVSAWLAVVELGRRWAWAMSCWWNSMRLALSGRSSLGAFRTRSWSCCRKLCRLWVWFRHRTRHPVAKRIDPGQRREAGRGARTHPAAAALPLARRVECWAANGGSYDIERRARERRGRATSAI